METTVTKLIRGSVVWEYTCLLLFGACPATQVWKLKTTVRRALAITLINDSYISSNFKNFLYNERLHLEVKTRISVLKKTEKFSFVEKAWVIIGDYASERFLFYSPLSESSFRLYQGTVSHSEWCTSYSKIVYVPNLEERDLLLK